MHLAFSRNFINAWAHVSLKDCLFYLVWILFDVILVHVWRMQYLDRYLTCYVVTVCRLVVVSLMGRVTYDIHGVLQELEISLGLVTYWNLLVLFCLVCGTVFFFFSFTFLGICITCGWCDYTFLSLRSLFLTFSIFGSISRTKSQIFYFAGFFSCEVFFYFALQKYSHLLEDETEVCITSNHSYQNQRIHSDSVTGIDVLISSADNLSFCNSRMKSLMHLTLMLL